MTRVSVALATYNGALFLSEQLDSLLEQTRLPDEIVVRDDGSTDATREILQDYAARYPALFRLELEGDNLGYRDNFSRVAALCSGDWVFFCDQDDFWLPHKIERVLEAAAKRPEVCLWLNDAEMADASLRPLGHTIFGNARRAGLSADWCGAGCCMAVQRDLLALALPISRHRSAHDNWLAEVAAALEVRGNLAEVLQLYRRHGTNQSASIAARAAPPGRFAALRLHTLDPVLAAWREEIDAREELAGRLMARPAADPLLARRQSRAAACLTAQAETARQRCNLIAQPRFKRVPAILALAARGGYGQANGWRSAVKDFVRPREFPTAGEARC